MASSGLSCSASGVRVLKRGAPTHRDSSRVRVCPAFPAWLLPPNAPAFSLLAV